MSNHVSLKLIANNSARKYAYINYTHFSKKPQLCNFQIKINIEGDKDSDKEESKFDYDETALGSFLTPLDNEDTSPDEYQIFPTIGET